MVDLKLLKSLALAATPGPWFWQGNHALLAGQGKRAAILTSSSRNHTDYLAECNADGLLQRLDPQGPNVKFIETAHPSQVLALIGALETARKVLDEMADCPSWVEQATIPKAGIDAAPEQVVVNMSCGYLKYKKMCDTLSAISKLLGETTRKDPA